MPHFYHLRSAINPRIVLAALCTFIICYSLIANVDTPKSAFSTSNWISPPKFPLKSLQYSPSPPHLEAYFPPPDPSRKDYREWNAQTLRELQACITLNTCGPNQRKVALLASHWFEESVIRGFRGGEGIWGMSVYKNLRILGYTTVFADSFEEALYYYRMMPDLINVVIRQQPAECHNNPKCVKSTENPSGIPAWKIFDFQFFASRGTHKGASKLGGKWILSANPDDKCKPGEESPIQYIGYSVEEICRKTPLVPLSQRRAQVWMLMKELVYVHTQNFAWNRSYFTMAAEELNMKFVGGWKKTETYQWDVKVNGHLIDIEDREHGVINMGFLPQEKFSDEVSMSKIMIGVGSPWWSPSPYNALCQGVPFLNPILRWKASDPHDRSSWYTQHPSLNYFDPPYVYNVHARNYTGFVEAIKAASTTEIGRFIPEYMTEASLRERLVTLMETDWKSKAAELLEERLKEGGDAYTFEL